MLEVRFLPGLLNPIDFSAPPAQYLTMKRKGFILILFVLAIGILAIKTQSSQKTFSNKDFSFSLKYPSTMRVKSQEQSPPESLHEYFYANDKEVFRLHVYPNEPPSKPEFFVETATIGNNSFVVSLFPAGSNSGDVVLTEPILYYDTFRENTEFSFQFNNQTKLDDLQTQILSTLKFTE